MATEPTPTDAEIDAVLTAVVGGEGLHADWLREIGRPCARAVLACFGVLRADKIVIPTHTMEQEFQKHYRRGYEAGQKTTTPQPTQAQAGAVPLTDEQITAAAEDEDNDSTFMAGFATGVRFAEQHHGIGIKGGQHGAAN